LDNFVSGRENNMPIQITIIGLGQIGTSIGLALAGKKDLITRMGHDKEPGVAKKAEKLGAVDKTQYNLPASVRDADIVLLAIPFDGIRATLEFIGQDLKEGAVVMDTTAVKGPVFEWAKQYIPEGRFYVGLIPALGPGSLHEMKAGMEAARADLFQKGIFGIVAPQGTPGEAVKLAADLTRLLGAEPFFTELAESDSLMASLHLLPQLVSTALIGMTVDQPGWLEGRKLASRAYAGATGVLFYQDTVNGLRDAVLADRENTLRVLDTMIASLSEIRDEIDSQAADQLGARIEKAIDGWAKWWSIRQKGDWYEVELGDTRPEAPSAGDYMRKLFLGKLGTPPEKKK
jgi:prephenate dehydrogenase